MQGMTAGVGLWGGLNCLLGRHVRSRGQARATADGWVTRCARCAIPMARANGGGSWEVVKTPMRNKPRKKRGEAPAETLAKAIVRSGKEARRKEAKAQKKALKAASLETEFDRFDEQDAVLPEPERGRFRRKRKGVGQPKSGRGPRRFLFFRGKALQPDAADVATDPVIDAASDDPAPRKARRSLFRRKRKPGNTGDPAAAPTLAQEAAIVAAASKRTLNRRRKHRDTSDASSEASDAAM